uniref:Uncharacterized protein n=1 Tax=Tanacetum cinerariifolium TaxID=118510 RepID=A0A699I019_TANCI|nr:hypothetical protein [Tanacetum cinerariifolium]
MKSIRKFVPIENEGQIADSKAGEGSSKEGERLKRPAKEELGQELQKKQKVKKDLSQERLQQMMVIILEQGIHVEALQTNLVKERFSSSDPTKDKEIALWVELKRLLEPDEDDELWKFKSFELIWRLNDWCGRKLRKILRRWKEGVFRCADKVNVDYNEPTVSIHKSVDELNADCLNVNHKDNEGKVNNDDHASNSNKSKETYAKIAMDNKIIKNKLWTVPTVILDDDKEVVIFDDELVALGSKK